MKEALKNIFERVYSVKCGNCGQKIPLSSLTLVYQKDLDVSQDERDITSRNLEYISYKSEELYTNGCGASYLVRTTFVIGTAFMGFYTLTEKQALCSTCNRTNNNLSSS